MTTITYKTILAGNKPYHSKEKDDYLTFLRSNQENIYSGEIGIYLSRRINVDGQNLYFPFIDIDGDKNLQGHDEKIESAIFNTSLTCDIFKKLGVEKHFSIIATGSTGFRIVSNILLDIDTYRAFVDFIKTEMPHISDPQPSEELEMPHQLFVYKGIAEQNKKELVDRHSTVIPAQRFGSGTITPDYYREITEGRPDPDEVVQFMEQFLDFQPISDLDSLGEFGRIIKEYKKYISNIISFKPFSIPKFRGKSSPIALEVIKEKLLAQNIPCRIRNIKGQNAISFYGLPCPLCKDTSSNAWAYPPSYKLRCFNSDCLAHREKGGVPLIDWAGLNPSNREINLVKDDKNNGFCLNAPKEFESLEEVRAKINRELDNKDDTLFILTPGTGKSHMTLKYIAENMKDKLILYSCYNKDLRDEAYKKIIKEFSASPDQIHVLKSREDLCYKKDELEQITSKGFSPKEILCKTCQFNNECTYYKQRENISTGIYFITHHMLQHLEDIIPSPDLLILDEDIKKGFLIEDGCSEKEMRTLAKILNEYDYSLIDQIHKIGQMYIHQAIEKSEARILNSKRLIHDEDSILNILAIHNHITEDEITRRISDIVLKFDTFSRKQLYERGVCFKAINWINGLISKSRHSCILVTEKGEIYFNLKHITPLGYSSTPIKILDATGNGKIAQALTGRKIKVINGDVEWSSKKIHIKRSTSRSEMRTIKDKHLRELLSIALKKMASEKILVVTYKEWKERVLRLCNEIDSSKDYMDYYFQGARGVNNYEKCDGVLVLGLPYPNINSAYQDAHIIFTDENDEESRNLWIDSSMMYELIQNIHRIRPVNKNNSEIVIISSSWPKILPQPDEIIDRSKNKNWKDLVIQRLDPYVKEFGLLNADIGYLAGVYIKNKGKNTTDLISAINFRKKINELIKIYESAIESQKKGNFKDTNCLMTGEVDNCIEVNKLNFKRKRIIFVIDKYIKHRLSFLKNINLLTRIKNLSCNPPIDTIPLANTKQWQEILAYFKEKYHNFESLKIKLPHFKNQMVNGVGDKRSVIDFYDQISQLNIFGKINTQSYRTLENRVAFIDPIPDNLLVTYIPDEKKSKNIIYLGNGDNITSISIADDMTPFKNLFSGVIESKKIITNNAKELAKRFILAGIDQCDIYDVVLNERIIRNGDVLPEIIKPEDLFKQYELSQDVDLNMMMPQLFQVWEKQQRIIDELNLRNIIELENRTIWITANLELTGIGIDVVGMLEYQETIESESPHDHKAINGYLNLLGNDYRVHDHFDQLGTVTGRFSCGLHTVKKDGCMRSFFRAQEGYKFAIADYSQHEPRILFGLSNDRKNIQALKEDRDIYVDLIRAITGKSQGKCREYRSIGKQVILSLINGKSLFTLYDEIRNKIDISMNRSEFKRFIETYYSNVFTWRDGIVKESRERGFISTLFGRRRNISLDTSTTSLFNYPVQGTASDGFKLALTYLDDELRDMDAKIVHIIHDEVIVEARDDITEDVAGIMVECMEKSFRELLPHVPFKVEPRIQDTWGIKN